MAKTDKSPRRQMPPTAPASAAAATAEPKATNQPAVPKRKRSAKKSATTSRKKPPAALRAGKVASPGSAPATSQPSDEEVRLRAYFIAERRMRLGLAGNADTDWLDALRQLSTEDRPESAEPSA